MSTKPDEPIYPGLTEVGLTKREQFAAMAMHGILANPHRVGRISEITEGAVIIADSLIAALNAEGDTND
jgi:hypothetical protein